MYPEPEEHGIVDLNFEGEDQYADLWPNFSEIKNGDRVKVRFNFFRETGKWYSTGIAEITKTPDLIYPQQYARKILSHNIYPGLSCTSWDGHIMVEVGFPALMIKGTF